MKAVRAEAGKPTLTMGSQLLRVRDVQTRLALSRNTVYSLIASGNLPVVRIGGAIRVDEADLEAWLEANKAGGAA